MDYDEFLEKKSFDDVVSGFDIELDDLNPKLFDFQKSIIKWALAKGRAAVFADTGLGKTAMQTTWAHHVNRHTDEPVLILAPLAVAHQTVKEAKKFGVEIEYKRNMDGVQKGIYITNYEMIDKFDIDYFTGIVLDESSILKSQTGKYRTELIDRAQLVPYRLSCTATPSPNDFMELGNQCQFFGVMSQSEMLAMFFINDTGNTGTWRLKKHAGNKFWEWMSTWACVIRKPSDLGFKDDGYDLPPFNVYEHVIESPVRDGLFADTALTLSERRQAKKETIDQRCKVAAELVNNSDDKWIIWCNLNDEQNLLNQLINNAVSVQGSDKDHEKEDRLLGFADCRYKNLITKSSIAGFGLNFQSSRNMVFVGLDDSFEKYYQAVRRQHRFGQEKQVNVHIVRAESEGAIKLNLERKQKQHEEMSESMIKHMRDLMKEKITGIKKDKTLYDANLTMELPEWIQK